MLRRLCEGGVGEKPMYKDKARWLLSARHDGDKTMLERTRK
jgi:hypothetical protein